MVPHEGPYRGKVVKAVVQRMVDYAAACRLHSLLQFIDT
jgi:hypothetical protein